MLKGLQGIRERAKLVTKKQMQQRDKPIKLTNEDKFALAFVAGVRVFYERDDNMLEATTEPCGVGWDGNKFVVLVGAA